MLLTSLKEDAWTFWCLVIVCRVESTGDTRHKFVQISKSIFYFILLFPVLTDALQINVN